MHPHEHTYYGLHEQTSERMGDTLLSVNDRQYLLVFDRDNAPEHVLSEQPRAGQ